ncbi:hypothetical protein E4T51_14051 [Aureobasidium sp. EXF-12344]|nr:hypothetical protein E4T51_14051 [Aureobasidium sp. EXF-12344]
MSRSPSPQAYDTGPSQRAARENRKLSTFFSDKTLSDVIVKFGNQEIFAHRLILVKSSVWFEKALLGEFKESKQTVIDIGDDDDPIAVTAMLRFFYEGNYCLDDFDGKSANQHLTMYRLVDLYDAPDLRKAASRHLINSFRAFSPGWNDSDQHLIADRVVQLVQQILGPSADTFADNSIQQDVFKFILQGANSFYNNELFQELLSNGSMFSEAFGRRFAQKTGELITRLKSRSHNSFGTDSPLAEPWNTPYSWDVHPCECSWARW